ncbi:helix-turn-helix transcriptional regulator [Salipaludibacillus sp. HK11]|uniref:helix-turn-helix transcriptional regulator n=1 Tax=Salipaludibacillus sp. HK11 TaxID=3394320 RepID=UPI0039FCEDB9
MEFKIKEIRLSKGITQKYVAKKVGISQSYLSNLEKNKFNPSAEIMFKIADVLKCKVDDFR